MSLGARLKRLYYRRLLAPLLRGKHAPDYTARGAAVGLASAFTPLVGIQMPIVGALWVLIRRFFPRWEFNLVAALALTWITNVATAPLAYYLFLVTGRIILGRWDEVGGFEAFEAKLSQASSPDASWFESLWLGIISLFETFGVPMFVGCVPWAILMGWFGYRASYSLVVRVRASRQLREAGRRA